mmetsp:Transcript_28494/g.66714  ORF Transcript_28494/g.66714 Transcript_28494/m.66714 type:complete len:220 (+) Transcript_28494:1400-2059(+)
MAQHLLAARAVVLHRLTELRFDGLDLTLRRVEVEERAREEGDEAVEGLAQVVRVDVEVADGVLRVGLAIVLAAVRREKGRPRVLLRVLGGAHEEHVLDEVRAACELGGVREVADADAERTRRVLRPGRIGTGRRRISSLRRVGRLPCVSRRVTARPAAQEAVRACRLTAGVHRCPDRRIGDEQRGDLVRQLDEAVRSLVGLRLLDVVAEDCCGHARNAH